MRFIFSLLCFIPFVLNAQNTIQQLLDEEHEKGHFNGSVLCINETKKIKINKGYSNFQFEVKIDNNTRFPIASITKLFTSLAILQLHEKGLLNFNDKIGKYIPSLPENCQNINIKNLLIHHSGLQNEPINAVLNKYSIDDYIANFVIKSEQDTLQFNYNNVDFIILSKIIEIVTKKEFSKSIEDNIIKPIQLNNTGFVNEGQVIKNLAYGYHNYSFGHGDKGEPLFNDKRYISNYYGAGAMYSTLDDLYQLLIAIKENKLISENTKDYLLLKPQSDIFIDWLSGKPTYGFYFDETNNSFRRSGSIDGFNSQIIIDKNFSKFLIILCNTDTADLKEISNKIFNILNK